MKLYRATIKIGGSNDNTIVKDTLTANDIVVLRHIHGVDAVVHIEQNGSVKRNWDKEWNRLMTQYKRKYVREVFPGASVRLFPDLVAAGIDIEKAADADTPQFLGTNDRPDDSAGNVLAREVDDQEETEEELSAEDELDAILNGRKSSKKAA